jgi:hypothetical protein
MTTSQRPDRYNEIAVMSPQDFELRGSGLIVPLHFRPNAAFIVRTVLGHEGEFTRGAVVEAPEFAEICGYPRPLADFRDNMRSIRFTLDALGSTLIQTRNSPGLLNVYQRNPNYSITGDWPLTNRNQ